MKLTVKQNAFVDAFVANELAAPEERLPLYKVALNAGAGNTEGSAATYAANALKNVDVIAEISKRKAELLAGAEGIVAGVDAHRILTEWAQIAVGDPTTVVNVRRLNCRHCWGVGHSYQHTDAEYARGTALALQNGDDLSEFDGGGGFDKLREPNVDCPECRGEGVENFSIADFRRLTPAQRRLIANVKMGKHGIEVQFRDQDVALLNLARWLGLVVNKNELSGPGGGPIQTANVNYTLPSDPVEAARAYQRLMEGKTK